MRELQGSEYTDDDGTAPAGLAAALEVYDKDPEQGYLPALAEVGRSRLLVPVVAVLGEVEYDDQGRATDKSSDMAAVLLQRPDGRKGMLAFTSTESMTCWNSRGRPVPASAATAAQAALHDGAVALVIDVTGPVQLVVSGDDLTALAQGWQLVRLEDERTERWGWIVRPEA